MTGLRYLTPLDADERADAGLLPEWTFALRDSVRFAELDALNHVNNAAYLTWFETLRVQYMGAYGITQYSDTDPRLVVASLDLSFHREMTQGEDYIVAGRTDWYGTSSFGMRYAVFAPDLRTTGHAVVVLRTRDGAGNWPLSPAQIDTLTTRDGATPRK